LAFSTQTDPRIPAISLQHDGPEEYENMWQKVRSIWKFVSEHYLEEFDYFMLGGDDLYILPGNLRAYLKDKNPEDDFFAGRRFKQTKGVYFNSGGAGYVLSRGLLRKYSTEGYEHNLCSPNRHTSMEDVMMANCLRHLFHVELVDTRDDVGRERFHPFAPGHHYTWKPPREGQPSDWYELYNEEWPVKLGKDCCAPDSVSFHYLKKPTMVRHIHSLLYFCEK
jgi:glycoprotein-N-acetylgalactosamine 3-beta-galactosyltransferase